MAVIVAVVCADTVLVVMVNEALVLPLGMVTLDGTTAEALLLLRLTTAPPDGALPLRRTVPTEVLPLATDVGFSVSEDICAALTVNGAVTAVPRVAVRVTVVVLATPDVE